MDIVSQKACERCDKLEKCVSIAMHEPNEHVNCIYFGHAKKLANDCIDMINTRLYEYLIHHIGNKEN